MNFSTYLSSVYCPNLNKITNEKEKRWLYTLYHSYSIHFINKNPGFEESIKFFEEELNSDKYPIYEEVKVPIMIKKILESNQSVSTIS